MSKTAKFLIGAGITAAIAGLALLAHKKINAPKILPEHIDFKCAETLDEAKKFGMDIWGIKKYTGFTGADLDVVNWANQGLVHVNNAAKGKALMPKSIVYDELEPGINASMSREGILCISKNYIQEVKDIVKAFLPQDDYAKFYDKLNKKNNFSFWQNTFLNILKKNKNLEEVQDVIKEIHNSTWGIISHEMGHWQHQNNIGTQLYGLTGKPEEIKKVLDGINKKMPEANKSKIFQTNIEKSKQLLELFEKSKETAGKVSDYAKASPLEFVAECYAKMVDGIKLDDDVMELYRKLGGVVI